MDRRLSFAAAAAAALTLLAHGVARAEPSPPAASDGDWTAAAGDAVQPLVALNPRDVGDYCPNYANLAPEQRRTFWVDFVTALAQAESGQDPGLSRFHAMDSDAGRPTFRRGLLQISIESANRPVYACGLGDPKALLEPGANIACGVKILGYWVAKDGVIASDGKGSGPMGAGRYWPTLAKPTPRAGIAGRTSAAPDCGAPA